MTAYSSAGHPLEATVRQLASTMLAEQLPSRWRHTERVAATAAAVAARIVRPPDRDILVSASLLHDLGYSDAVVRTGLHPLDGARYLQAEGWPSTVIGLVAHHTGAKVEARRRGLAEQLAALPTPPQELLDVLTFSDLTSGPDGAVLDVEDRLVDIWARYPPEHVVHLSVRESADALRGAVARVQQRLAESE